MKELKDLKLKDLIWFDKFLTPGLVTYLYWLGIAGSLVVGLVQIFSFLTFASFIMGIIYFIFGVIISRVFYELVIVLFRIHEKLEMIADIKAREATATKKTVAKAAAKPSRKPKTATTKK